ncbi:serine/threonine protein kinase [Fusarium austroafricanum]|uniref:Serine/threonine protein kinase n=1 Tax=Fusarium austroafricanum TaxID=2364996 RepID=A0A8H4KED9_9HYPO|nr:serine/threonine protein kinase [Fusarium austroafricanum]
MYSSIAQQRRSRGPVDGGQMQLRHQAYDFASFILVFNDIFVRDKYYQCFGMVNGLPISNVIGSGGQFTVRLFRLSEHTSVRTSDDPSSRLTAGEVVLKWPNLERGDNFIEEKVIKSIITELSVISHPGLREHPRILDIYGFAWDQQVMSSGESVLPVIMEEYGEFGTITQFLHRAQSVGLDTKLMLASDIAHAVYALHQNGIAHSDLKPDNILVVQHNAETRPMAKLSDFGLSIFLDQHDSTKVWTAGTRPWMAPEHMTPVTTDQLLKADVYSCGLILWSILLDGQLPWELEAFESNNPMESFELVKKDPQMLMDISIGFLRDSGTIPEERMGEISNLFESLLTTAEDRSLDLLLAYQPELLATPNANDISPPAHTTQSVTRINDFSDLHYLPVRLQRQILLAFRHISGRPEEETAEAYYAAAVMSLLRIGTVVPSAPGSKEYIGYDIDATQVLKLLQSAAEGMNNSDGSPSSQATFHRITRALTTGTSRKDGVLTNIQNIPERDPVSRQTTIKWLKRATVLGSHIASSTLRELDPNAWKEALLLFRTEYSGVGRKLLDDSEYKGHIANLSSLLNLPVSESIGESGDTALHVAATIGRIDVIQQLVQGASQASINKQNVRGETALLQATRSGHYNIVEFLLAVGASSGILTDNSECPLHWLCAFDDKGEDELLMLAVTLCHSGADIEGICTTNTVFNEHFRDSLGGGTPLCRAVQRNSYVAAKVLVTLGANPYKDREVGEQSRAPHAAALACCAHNSRMLKLFLTSDTPVQPPNWYGQPGIFDPQYSGEVIKAYLKGERTMQSAAPNAWNSTVERGSQSSLLGYAINPDQLHLRMALHGEFYLEQMQQTIDMLASLESQEFDRVTFDYQSAIKHSVLSRDISIVSYLLYVYPEQTIPELTNPVPSGLKMRLPVQLALSRGERPIFDLLLSYAGPESKVSPTKMKGMTDNWLSQGMLWLFRSRSTIASEKVSRTFKNTIHLAASVHPDPHFMRMLLSSLPPTEARELVNSHGRVWDEIPITMALANHYFDVADALVQYGADIEEEASNLPRKPGQSITPLGAVITFNNNGTIGAVDWLLRHGASNIVNQEYGITALMTAVRAGTMYDISKTEPLVPTRLYDLRLPVLERLLRDFSGAEQLNHKAEGLSGMTALHWGVMRLCPEAVRLLLNAGADPSLTAEFTRSVTAQEIAEALDVEDVPSEAKQKGTDEVVRYLERFDLLRRMFTLTNG